MMNYKQPVADLDELVPLTAAEQNRLDASLLAARFLQDVQRALDERNMTRKTLAAAMNTSASRLTQLFRGDKLPNLENLALMANILDLEFQISVVSKKASEQQAPSNAQKHVVRKSGRARQPLPTI